MDEEDLQLLYTWVDEIPLSRPKKNIARDFSDGVLMAEVVKHFFPKVVQLHNYSAASSQKQKMYNWNTLQQKVFKRINFMMEKKDVDDVVNCVPGAVERMLKNFQIKVTQLQQRRLTNEHNDSYGEEEAVAKPPPSGQYRPAHAPYQPQSIYQKAMENKQALPSDNAGGNSAYYSIQQPPQQFNNQHAPAHLQPPHHVHPVHNRGGSNAQWEEMIAERDAKINELSQTNQLLEAKINKLNLLIRLKDSKIHALSNAMKNQ